MRKVIGIGETVLDIIFKGGKPIEAVPGGSSFNAVISLGRAGVNASFISEAGNDRIGEYVIQFLRDNGVNADNVSIFPESKSPLSLAFLDEKTMPTTSSTRTILTTSWSSPHRKSILATSCSSVRSSP